MTVYIECVIIENFFYDFILLWCACALSKIRLQWPKLVLSAFFGGVFAVFYPLLVLPYFLGVTLKISVGFLLVFIAVPKKEHSRYGLSVFFFYLCAFCFAGGSYAFGRGYVLPCFLLFALICMTLGKKIYQSMRFSAQLTACKLYYRGKEWGVTGYLDSGNLARYNGLPVCFISAELFLRLYEEDRGQVLEEMRISTLAGSKKVRVFYAEISVSGKEKQPVYLGVSGNIIKKRYEVLLSSEMIV